MCFDEVSEHAAILENSWINSHWPVTTLTSRLLVLVLSALFTEVSWKKLVSQNQMDTSIAWNWLFSQKFGDNSGILRIIFKIPEMSCLHFEQSQFLNLSHPEIAAKHSSCWWQFVALLKLWLYFYPSSKCVASWSAAWPGQGESVQSLSPSLYPLSYRIKIQSLNILKQISNVLIFTRNFKFTILRHLVPSVRNCVH